MKRQRGVNFMCPDSGLGVEAHVKNNKKNILRSRENLGLNVH